MLGLTISSIQDIVFLGLGITIAIYIVTFINFTPLLKGEDTELCHKVSIGLE